MFWAAFSSAYGLDHNQPDTSIVTLSWQVHLEVPKCVSLHHALDHGHAVVDIDMEPEVLTHVHMIMKKYYLLRAYPRLPSRGTWFGKARRRRWHSVVWDRTGRKLHRGMWGTAQTQPHLDTDNSWGSVEWCSLEFQREARQCPDDGASEYVFFINKIVMVRL
jgi:hypothetical protein